MVDAMDKKFKNAGKEFTWQWLFPAKELTFVPQTGGYRLYHLHDRDVRTTMIYNQTVPSRTVKKAKSPLDF